jgi:hypothetical protein
MERLSWPTISESVEGRRITGLWYGLEDGRLRIELDDGSVLVVAACWEECHIVVETEELEDAPRLIRAYLRRRITTAQRRILGKWQYRVATETGSHPRPRALQPARIADRAVALEGKRATHEDRN